METQYNHSKLNLCIEGRRKVYAMNDIKYFLGCMKHFKFSYSLRYFCNILQVRFCPIDIEVKNIYNINFFKQKKKKMLSYMLCLHLIHRKEAWLTDV